jgi:hypothetical protein
VTVKGGYHGEKILSAFLSTHTVPHDGGAQLPHDEIRYIRTREGLEDGVENWGNSMNLRGAHHGIPLNLIVHMLMTCWRRISLQI